MDWPRRHWLSTLYVLLFATLLYTKYKVIEQIHKMQITNVHVQIWHNLWIHFCKITLRKSLPLSSFKLSMSDQCYGLKIFNKSCTWMCQGIKGQLNLKCLFDIFNSPKKWTKNLCPSTLRSLLNELARLIPIDRY